MSQGCCPSATAQSSRQSEALAQAQPVAALSLSQSNSVPSALGSCAIHFGHFRSTVTVQAQSLTTVTVTFDRGALFGLFISLLLDVFKARCSQGLTEQW